MRQYSLLFTRSSNIIHCYLFLILIHQLTQNLRSQDPDPQLVATIAKEIENQNQERKSQLRGNILDVVNLETSPGNKPRRVRFVVINDLGIIIETFTFREESRISSSSWDLHAFYLSSATGDVELRELLEEDFDEIPGSIYSFLSFLFFTGSNREFDLT